MILSADMIPYLVSDEYDQAQLLSARGNMLMATIKTARDHLEENQSLATEAVMDVYNSALGQLEASLTQQGGVCQCLVLQWLKLKMAERAQGLSGRSKVDPSTRMEQMSLASVLDRAVVVQKQASEEQLFTESLATAESEYGMTLAGDATLESTVANVANRVCNRTHGFFLFGFSIGEGAHAIGFYQSGGGFLSSKHVYVFDPNIGELKFKSSEFATLLAAFLEGTYGVENEAGPYATRILTEYSA